VFNRVKEVKPLADLMLLVTFANGVSKRYDVKALLKKFEPFRIFTTTPALFNLVKVDQGGYGIVWNDELDISCNELWNNGIPDQQKAA
jgi:hypothetical protein